MLNITVVPRFQKPWALTSALEYAGISNRPGLPANLAAPFTVLPLTLWEYPTVPVLPLAVPPSCCAPAPVLSPSTVILLILGL